MANFDVTIYSGNTTVSTSVVANDNMGDVTVNIPAATAGLVATLDPYQVIVKEQGQTDYQSKKIYVITPIIHNAISELKTFTDRINSKMRLSGLKFTDGDYAEALKWARDVYNAAGQNPTTIDMTAAENAIYGYWLMFAQVIVLRTRYLDEGLSSFDYQGAAIQLSVDHTMYLESLANAIEGQIDKGIDSHKKYLQTLGLTAGTGASTASNRVPGATGKTLGPLNSRGLSGLGASAVHY